MDKEEFESFYNEIYTEFKDDIKKKKITEQEKIQLVIDCLKLQYMVSLNVLDDSNFDVIKDIIKGKKVKDIDETLLNNYFVFKTDEGKVMKYH